MSVYSATYIFRVSYPYASDFKHISLLLKYTFQEICMQMIAQPLIIIIHHSVVCVTAPRTRSSTRWVSVGEDAFWGKWRLALWVLAAWCNQMFLEMTSCPVRWSRAPCEIKSSLPVTANTVLITWPGWAELESLYFIDATARPLRNARLKTLLLSSVNE